MDAYRDPLGALRSQIMTRRMVIAEVERGLLPLAITLLSEEEGAELAALREATSEGAFEAATVESLCEIERRLDAMHALLTGVAARWELPDEPSLMEAPPQPWAEGPPGMLEVRALLESSFGEGTAERFGSEAARRHPQEGEASAAPRACVLDVWRRDCSGGAGRRRGP